MLKRDRIFYAACGLSAVGALLAMMDYELALLLFVGAYLLRPALHEFGVTKQSADERQLTIHSRSGNIAFIAVILVAVGMALWRVANGQRAEELYPLIMIGLSARALTGLVMGGEYRKAGAVIIGAIGIFLGFFILMETGFSLGGLVGLFLTAIIVGIAWIAHRFPRPMAIILALMALLAIIGFELYDFRQAETALWLLFVTPMAVASACLFLGSGKDPDGVSPRTRTMVFGSLGGGAAIVFALLMLLGGDENQTVGARRGVEGEVVEVQGIPATGFIDYYKDGTLESCTLGRDDTLSGQWLPAGTVVIFKPDSTFDWCFLQQVTEIQGHRCKGSGHNFMTCFHPNGQLRLAWLDEDEMIDGIPCAAFSYIRAIFKGGGGTHFHPNGRLRLATLSKDFEIEGQSLEKGAVVNFDTTGMLITTK